MTSLFQAFSGIRWLFNPSRTNQHKATKGHPIRFSPALRGWEQTAHLLEASVTSRVSHQAKAAQLLRASLRPCWPAWLGSSHTSPLSDRLPPRTDHCPWPTSPSQFHPKAQPEETRTPSAQLRRPQCCVCFTSRPSHARPPPGLSRGCRSPSQSPAVLPAQPHMPPGCPALLAHSKLTGHSTLVWRGPHIFLFLRGRREEELGNP